MKESFCNREMMIDQSIYASKLRLSKRLDYWVAGIVLSIAALVVGGASIIGFFNELRRNELDLNFLTGFMLNIGSSVLFLFIPWFCFLSAARGYIRIDSNGIIYRNAFNNIILSWSDILGFAYTDKTIFLVYNEAKLPKRPKWLRWMVKTEPMIPLHEFTNEWTPKNKTMGPLISAVLIHAPHFFGEPVNHESQNPQVGAK